MRNKSVSFEFAEIGVGGLIDLCCVSDGEEEEQNKDNILFKAQIVFLFMKLIPYFYYCFLCGVFKKMERREYYEDSITIHIHPDK